MSGMVDELLTWIEAEEEGSVVGPVKGRAELAHRNGMMTVLMSLSASVIEAQRDIIRDHDQSAESEEPDSKLKESERDLKKTWMRLEACEQELKKTWAKLTDVEMYHSKSTETKRCKECRAMWPCRTVLLVNPDAYDLAADDE